MIKSHIYLTRQKMLSSDYEIYYYSDTELEKVNLHHHDFYECYLFLSGDVSYIIEGRDYTLRPGDIILINTKELHQPIIHSKAVSYDRIVLWINKAFLYGLSSESLDLSSCFEANEKGNVIRTNVDNQQNIKTLLYKLLQMEVYGGLGRELLYKAYITELLVLLNTLVFKSSTQLDIEIKKSNLIEDIIVYINQHLEEDIRIEDLSELFYISKFHLLREFKKFTGTTIHKFIIQKKLILSKELILAGNPITSVYSQCGFGDYSNFFRAFKNEYGVTPKQFYTMMNAPDETRE